jgi:hypothetical protein
VKAFSLLIFQQLQTFLALEDVDTFLYVKFANSTEILVVAEPLFLAALTYIVSFFTFATLTALTVHKLVFMTSLAQIVKLLFRAF